MDLNKIKVLEDIINQGIEEISIPHVSGNSIRIKHLIVRKSQAGWLVYNSKTHRQVAKLFCKSSAIALAKSLADGMNAKSSISELDKIIEKNYNDCIFYKNTLNTSTDSFKRAVTLNRFEISLNQTKLAKKSLDRFIFH